MKKEKINLRSMVMALFVAFSLTVSVSALAHERHEGIPEKSSIVLKFIGNADHQLSFQLNLNNTEEDEYTITIGDMDGNLFYSDRVKGVNISRKFRLNDEIADETLHVKVKSRKTNKQDVFEIKSSSHVVEERFITKL